ncbi:MAG TPA: PEP-CTERM sorting domain-containing protein [Bryobacteraceae bacterium]|nr:PEP-CTERM sorting domain-containing protein [Bryobacteraceae bacterium]
MYRLLPLLLLLPAPAYSATIYDNGPPNQADGSEITGFVQAEDFTLAASSTFDSIRFWTLEDATSFSGSILWWIYSDNNGEPDSILFSGTGVPEREPTLLTGLSLAEYLNRLSIPSVTLAPGTYWLALHNGPISNGEGAQMFWETADPNASVNFGQELGLPEGTWTSNSLEHSFQLANSDIPEPGTMMLGITALAAFAAARRRMSKI